MRNGWKRKISAVLLSHWSKTKEHLQKIDYKKQMITVEAGGGRDNKKKAAYCCCSDE